MGYSEFFSRITGSPSPYPYQARLADGDWPDILDVPTGLGKTAAVTVAWLFRRIRGDTGTPRRLIWCLPMRVLVEQTVAAIDGWMAAAAPEFEAAGIATPRMHVLMGGRVDHRWIERPEEPAVVVGTQDMLLSRALMRGYGMSRYRWPMDFALLHNDGLWVFDEVQLMGTGLSTSAQLEAFRRLPGMAHDGASRSLWMSATLQPDWLATIDFRPHVQTLRVAALDTDERRIPSVSTRLHASKRLVKSEVSLVADTKSATAAYVRDLAASVLSAHDGTSPTLVVVNRVERAQELAKAISRGLPGDSSTEVLLVHARFRRRERDRLNERLRRLRAGDDVILVATQAVEAGVDLTSARLFTELAPWSSIVQRFGRCNRGGEYADAIVTWVDMDTRADPKLCRPYEIEELNRARSILRTLSSAASADLPPVKDGPATTHVLRRRDLLELYDTDPDLSGFDLDVSRYVRDAGSPQVQVFWRAFEGAPGSDEAPLADELCPVSIGQVKDHLKKRAAFAWDALMGRWAATRADSVLPGQTLMLRAAEGGYDPDLGFLPGRRGSVEVLELPGEPQPGMDRMDGDVRTAVGRWVTLARHSADALKEAKMLAELAGEQAAAVCDAALNHDIGKIHPAFLTPLLDFDVDGEHAGEFWAKSGTRGRLVYRVETDGESVPRPHFRHELASALSWLSRCGEHVRRDLVPFLIAAHHGRVRMGLRALPAEATPPDDGLWLAGCGTAILSLQRISTA